jgi:hypothetical protein
VSPPLGSALRRTIGKATHIAGLDADVLHTLTFRVWSMVAGAVVVLLVPLCLSSVEQGYYYTFASLLALQIFFELGMNQVILQLVSHDAAHAHSDGADSGHAGRLSALIGLLRRWYALAAVAFFLSVSAGGAWFLASNAALPRSQWLGPWIALTFATAANLSLSAMLAVLEGSGEVAHVARVRFHQSFLGYLAMWLALALGAGLWAAPLLPMMTAAYTAVWLRSHAHPLRRMRAAQIPAAPDLPMWRRDVFPLQWRIALSWISGYFIFQLLTPLAFARLGAVEAGRLGITLAVFNAILTAGMSWVNAKFPAISMHLARKERAQANALFRSVALRALGFTAVLSVAILVVLVAIQDLAPDISRRFASVAVAACIATVTLCNTLVFAAAAYMRAHKEEPMLWVSVVSGITVLAVVTAASSLGVLPMMALYMAVTAIVPLPWTLWLFRKYLRRTA